MESGVARSLATFARRSVNQSMQKRFYSAPLEGTIPPAKKRFVPESGTYPKGFRAAGVHVGVKASNTRFPDVALIESEVDCNAAAVFTKCEFAAAPVVLDKEILEQTNGEGIRSVVINSGCANAVTGKTGFENARKMVGQVDSSRGSSSSKPSTLVMSTGVIGNQLPINKILGGIPKAREILEGSHNAWLSTARAICTTDTFPKLRSKTFSLPSSPGTTYSLAGMSKGAGMIHPNMATLLGVMCTDVPIASHVLKPLLTYAADRSFNAISVDGDTSTNDTLALLANGAAGGNTISSAESEDALAFRAILTDFARSLAHLVVRDGEGATKFVHIRIADARTYEEAFKVAQHIAQSPLVKTALYAEDANWGRFLAKAGTVPGVAKGAMNPAATSLKFVPADGSEEMVLLKDGEPTALDEARAKEVLAFEDLEVVLSLGTGKEEASYWTCDFSHEYVTINGESSNHASRQLTNCLAADYRT